MSQDLKSRWEKLIGLEARAKTELKLFNSRVFVEMPQPEIHEVIDYHIWLLGIESTWMKDFNNNESYRPDNVWNKESGVCGRFNGIYLICKFYRYDETVEAIGEEDFRAKRGVLIRDHYSPLDVGKVHLIADNLQEFLKSEGIVHNRINYKR